LESTAERVVEMGAVVLVWPALIGSVIAYGLATARHSRRLAAIGWALASPMLGYLALSARFRYSAPIAWCALGLSVWAVKRRPGVALAFLAPWAAHVLFLGYMVGRSHWHGARTSMPAPGDRIAVAGAKTGASHGTSR
jgi:hypothetical protein